MFFKVAEVVPPRGTDNWCMIVSCLSVLYMLTSGPEAIGEVGHSDNINGSYSNHNIHYSAGQASEPTVTSARVAVVSAVTGDLDSEIFQ
jgi:hypothetical protein